MSNSLENYINDWEMRCSLDAARYKTQDDDLCMLCHAYGADKRSLFVDCLYDCSEAINDFINLRDCGNERHKSGWYLRICKTCRGELLGVLRAWGANCKSRRNLPKDHDGEIEIDTEGLIPVRVDGATRWMTRGEYTKFESAVAPSPNAGADGASVKVPSG